LQPSVTTRSALEELAAHLKAEIAKWTKVVREAGIKAD
jgi:tripartite-type tricarboxylate transporter receptor subunit TctC